MRADNLMPDGIPKYIRCYDNGGASFDRYTVVFTGRYRNGPRDQFIYLSMSEYPCHPMGVGQHGQSDTQIDRPAYSHLGKKIDFNQLPDKCKELVIADYQEIWNIRS